jgi:hypothetical protein
MTLIFALAPPLLVMELLYHMHDVFVDYFGSCSETVILANTVIVYQVCSARDILLATLAIVGVNREYIELLQVLEEMLDNGFPLATESNILMVTQLSSRCLS